MTWQFAWYWFCITVMVLMVVINQVRDWAEHAEEEPVTDPKVFREAK